MFGLRGIVPTQAILSNVLGQAGWAARTLGDRAAARRHYEAGLAAAIEAGDSTRRTIAQCHLATFLVEEGNLDEGRAQMLESLAIRREAGSPQLGWMLNNLAELEIQAGNLEVAHAYLEESIHNSKHVAERPQQAGESLGNLARLDLRQGRIREAEEHCVEGIQILWECGAVVDLPEPIDLMGIISCRQSEYQRAALFFGAAQNLREETGVPSHYPDEVAEAQSAINLNQDVRLREPFEAGRKMALEEVVALCRK